MKMNPTDVKATRLSDAELTVAVDDLHVKDSLLDYRKVNRKLVDPQISGEPKFALFSFIKSKDETDGVFGVGKIRGAFYTQDEADARAEELIRDTDSVNSIYTCKIGFPFPLVVKGFSDDVKEVDIRAKVEDTISLNVREKRKEDQKHIDALKEREENLKRDVAKTAEDDEETYIEQRAKLAHLKYAIEQHRIQGEECEQLKNKVVKYLREHSEYEKTYLERYKSGRRAANIPEDTDVTGFMKFMGDDIE